MIPDVSENYNETVLIPILQDKITTLVNQNILLEAKLQIALKEKAALQKQLDDQALKADSPGEQNTN